MTVLKYGTQVLEPIAYNATRMTVGTVVLLGLAALTAPMPSRSDIGKLMLLGVLGHGVYQGLFINGLARTRAGTAALVVAASPAVIAIVGRALGVERISQRAVLGIGRCLALVSLLQQAAYRGRLLFQHSGRRWRQPAALCRRGVSARCRTRQQREEDSSCEQGPEHRFGAAGASGL